MATIEDGLSSGQRHDIAPAFGQLYRVNGWDPMSVWDGFGSAAYAAGIPTANEDFSCNVGSTGTNSAGVTPGTHFFRYRYSNSKTQYVSNPSKAIQFTARESNSAFFQYTFTGVAASPDPKVDRIIWEMTQADGEEFYQASVTTNASVNAVVRINDDNLRALPLLYDDFGHDLAPEFRYVEHFKGRLWGLGQVVYTEGTAVVSASGLSVVGYNTQWRSAAKGRLFHFSGDVTRFIGSVVSSGLILLEETAPATNEANYEIISETPDVLYASKALYPESWPVENAVRVLDGKPEKARAIKGYRTDLVIYGERSMERLVYASDPFIDGSLEPIEGDRGVASRLCIVDAGGNLLALDYKGIHAYTGGRGEPEHLSEDIDPLFDLADTDQGTVDFEYRDTFHSVHYPNRHQVLWFVVINGMPGDSRTYTKPHHAIVYDYKNKSFGLFKFDIAMVASTLGPGSDGTSQTLIGDEHGRCWVFGAGDTDGIHTSNAASVTVGAGATNMTLPMASGTTLYFQGDGLAGAAVYWPSGDSVARITGNDASNITLSGSGFGTSFPAGTSLQLGRIPIKWKSPAYFFGSPKNVMHEGHFLHLYYEPLAAGEIRVRFYLNRSSTAYTGYAESFSQGGITQDGSSNYYVVDVTKQRGYARIPIPSSADDGDATVEDDAIYVLEFEIETIGAVPFQLSGFEVDGAAQEEDLEP